MPFADPQSPAAMVSMKKAHRRFYEANREQEIARSAKYQRDNPDKVNSRAVVRRSQKLPVREVLWWNARNRAKAKGLVFSLTFDDIIVPSHCPALGIELQVGTGFAKANSPSLDRIDPDRGYVVGNVQVISHKANTIKSNASLSDLRMIVSYMEKAGAA